uniref:Coiled-coil domain-containing protein 93 n=1 Tax=Plectus sambesii TaxID=2011161 RepID=A0A914VHC9_9BILA
MGDVLEERGRMGLTAAIDGESFDQQIKFDIREDEEQNVKLLETVELLTAAGYFRARIKGLTAFDKVVGGMVWCISLCNFDVDVDLLYSENSTIGQKIALTERIVKVLPKLKCPHTIEPHQIQGLDFIHIFPVVQWLVKKAIIAKEEIGDQVQQLAVYQFDSKHRLPEEELRDKAQAKSIAVQKNLKHSNDPKRIYKKRPNLVLDDESQRVHCTLLEYGWKGKASVSESDSSEKGKKATTSDSPNKQEQTTDLLGKLHEVGENELKLSAATVASLIDTENIQKMAEHYAKETKGIPRGTESGGPLTVDDLRGQIADVELLIETLQKGDSELLERIESERSLYEGVRQQEEQLEAEAARVAELESNVDREMAERLRELMAEHDVIRQKEREFKEKCRRELTEMDAEIDRLEQPFQVTEDRTAAVAEHSAAADELQRRRLELADLNRKVAALQRRIDEVPSQTELNQYQKRFLELYNQVASKHRETKQFYTLHNTLLDVKAYMKREIDLLDNIYNVQGLATQESYKRSFVQNLEDILTGVKQNKTKVDRRQAEEKMKRDIHRDNYQEMLDKQRLYYKTVKDFQDECKRNEELQARLKELGIAIEE